MSVFINLPIEFTDEQWEDHILGSGAEQWAWWKGIYSRREEIIVDYYTDIDEDVLEGERGVKRAYTSLYRLALAAERLASQDAFVARQLINDDVDADGADRIIQFDVFGKVLYS